MKMHIIKITILLGFVVFLASCSTADFYRYQGLNATECGPAVACMVAELNGKPCKSVSDARQTNKRVKYWDFADIKTYLNSRGIEAHNGTGEITIYKVRYFYKWAHFVVVVNNVVYDTAFGVYSFNQINKPMIYKEKLGISI